MKYAFLNGHKTEAQRGARGICINCRSDMIAKCGQVKVPHWAHKSKKSCDPWWENETEWHRVWKNHFPTEWQESIHIDSATREKHIADIKTDKEFVIEFQHSAIRSTEILSRETFYKNMVWVVDGARLKRDYPRFCKGFGDLKPLKIPGIFLSLFPKECFPTGWLASSAPVYFDFQDREPSDQQDKLRSVLWCLFPGRVDGGAVIAGVPREDFIKFASTTPHLLFAREMLSNISKLMQLKRTEANRGKYPQVAPRRQYARRFRL